VAGQECHPEKETTIHVLIQSHRQLLQMVETRDGRKELTDVVHVYATHSKPAQLCKLMQLL